MKKIYVFIFTMVVAFTIVSCSNGAVNEEKSNSSEVFMGKELTSLEITNNFLKSLKGGSTRSGDKIVYPEYYGGYYISSLREPIFLVVKGMEVIAQKDITQRAGNNFFKIEECKYSYNTLNSILEKLDIFFFDKKFDQQRHKLGWVGYCIGIEENKVKIYLEDCSDRKIIEFKQQVLDSPLIEFFKGSKILAVNDRKSTNQSISSPNNTRSTTQLNLGGPIYISDGGDGSIGYRASRYGSDGFVTCGHVAPFGVTVKLTRGGEDIGYTEVSYKGGLDAAFVTLYSPYSVSSSTAYRSNYIKSNIVILGKNNYVQKEGWYTSWSQGTVTDTGYRGDFGSYTVNNLTVTNYNAEQGDSGGVVYSTTNDLVGIHVGSSREDRSRHYYSLADDINNQLGTSAY